MVSNKNFSHNITGMTQRNKVVEYQKIIWK